MPNKFYGRTQFAGKTYWDRQAAGSDSEHTIDISAIAYKGTKSYRQGAMQINMTRPATGALASWDGNPDTALKMLSVNYATNGSSTGGTRVLDIQARNRGATHGWVKAMELNGRNDSGKAIDTLIPMHIRAENYGTVETDIVGLDVELSSESDGGSPTKDGILVRNTDQSGMTAVGSVIKVTHSSANGFTNFLRLGADTGDSYTAKATAVANLGNTLGYLLVDINGTPGRIPIFDLWS